MKPKIDRLLELADAVEQFEFCSAWDEQDALTAYLYGFKSVAKRFVGAARRTDDAELQEELKSVHLDPCNIEDAYDLHADLVPIIDLLRDKAADPSWGDHASTSKDLVDSASDRSAKVNAYINRLLELAHAVEQFQICGPWDESEAQSADLYEFKAVAKRFVGAARRIDDAELQGELASVHLNPECIQEAYDLHADLAPIIDHLRDKAKDPSWGDQASTSKDLVDSASDNSAKAPSDLQATDPDLTPPKESVPTGIDGAPKGFTSAEVQQKDAGSPYQGEAARQSETVNEVRPRRGPPPKTDQHRKLAGIVQPYGVAWKEDKNLRNICKQADQKKVLVPPQWFPTTTWKGGLTKYRDKVIKVIEYRLNTIDRLPSTNN